MSTLVTDSLRERFATYRTMAERALAQVPDDAFFQSLPGLDPLAIQVKHLAGNYRSRWTDFRTADGDKPDRHRDTEFDLTEADTREALMARWAEGWRLHEMALAPLTDADLGATVTIRAEPHTIIAALNRSLAHTAYHVGQNVLLAKHLAGDDWQTLSIARGQSEQFRAEMLAKAEARRDADIAGLPPRA
ncbi:MAG: DUF1572 family protein [Bacteroidota bacterium]